MESQEIEMALNTLTISPIEITIIGLISLIGVLSNIFCITVLNKKSLHIKVYTRLIHIVISVILSSTICITLDPYIMYRPLQQYVYGDSLIYYKQHRLHTCF